MTTPLHPHMFVSLGIYNDCLEKYAESTLFPINTTITLNSNQTHCIGGKNNRIHVWKDNMGTSL